MISISRSMSRASLLVLVWGGATSAGGGSDALLFSRAVGDACEVGLLALESDQPTTLHRLDRCPENLFYSQQSGTLFVIDDDSILEIDPTGSGGPRRIAPLPEFGITRYSEHELRKPDEETLRMMHTTVMHARTIGYLADGALAIDLELEHPAGGSYAYLLRWNGVRWSVAENGGCGTWDLECRFEALPGRSTEMWDWPQEQLVQYVDGPSNPHFVADEDRREMFEDGEAGYLIRRFDVGGVPVEIQVWTSSSAHFDLVYPFEIRLVRPTGTTTICDAQCRAALADRYLLAQRFWGGTLELYDIASGDSVLGELANAMWIPLSR